MSQQQSEVGGEEHEKRLAMIEDATHLYAAAMTLHTMIGLVDVRLVGPAISTTARMMTMIDELLDLSDQERESILANADLAHNMSIAQAQAAVAKQNGRTQ